jgi:hypothetical protein
MALAGGVFARSYVARDSGAAGYVYASSTRLIGAVDDALFLSCGTARIPGMDDAGIVVRFWHRLGVLLCVDSTAVEHLSAGLNRHSGTNLSSPKALNQGLLSSRRRLPSQVHFHEGIRSENRCAGWDRFDCK